MKSSVSNKFIVVLRICLGWLFLYAGATKVFNNDWTSAGYLTSAKTFTGFYSWLASADLIPFIDFINKWGLTFLGISLILGLFVRLSSYLGAALMILYYFPVLTFPYIVSAHAFLIDDHIIYAIVLLALAELRAGRSFGLDTKFRKLDFCRKYKGLCEFLG